MASKLVALALASVLSTAAAQCAPGAVATTAINGKRVQISAPKSMRNRQRIAMSGSSGCELHNTATTGTVFLTCRGKTLVADVSDCKVYAFGVNKTTGKPGFSCPRGFFPIQTENHCSNALKQLQVADTTVSALPAAYGSRYPLGCYVTSNEPQLTGSVLFVANGNPHYQFQSYQHYTSLCQKGKTVVTRPTGKKTPFKKSTSARCPTGYVAVRSGRQCQLAAQYIKNPDTTISNISRSSAMRYPRGCFTTRAGYLVFNAKGNPNSVSSVYTSLCVVKSSSQNGKLSTCDAACNGLNRCLMAIPNGSTTAAGSCPTNMATASAPNCASKGLKPGQYCEGDGECGSNSNLNNCNKLYDVYKWVATPPKKGSSKSICSAGKSCGRCLHASPKCTGTSCPKTCPKKMLSPSAPPCSSPTVKPGMFCEGDGECGTVSSLNNCPGGFDVYKRLADPKPPPPPVVSGIYCDRKCGRCFEPATVCKASMKTSRAPNCASAGIKIGDYCEADGECGTNSLLNNCGPYDVYMRTAPPGAATDSWHPIMKSDGGPTWEYDSPSWTDSSTMNTTTKLTDLGNAKWPAYNTQSFNYIKLCIARPGNCLVYKLSSTVANAKALFGGKYRAEGIIYSQFVHLFGVKGQKKCTPQLAGFNTVGTSGCAARWGFFGNIPGQACQGQKGDSDGAIGIGIKSQGGGELGSGWTSYFTSNTIGHDVEKQAWVFVRLGGASNAKAGHYKKETTATCEAGYHHIISRAQCNKAARAVKNKDVTSSVMSNFTSKRYPGGCLSIGSRGTLYFNVNKKMTGSMYHGTIVKSICVKGAKKPVVVTPPGKSVCKDVPSWVDAYGESCASYVKEKACTSSGGYGSGWDSAWGTFADSAPMHGVGANKACCKCGGGTTAGAETQCEKDAKATGVVGKACYFAKSHWAIRPRVCPRACASVFTSWYNRCKADPSVRKNNRGNKIGSYASLCAKGRGI